jgi:hypothetical protein
LFANQTRKQTANQHRDGDAAVDVGRDSHALDQTSDGLLVASVLVRRYRAENHRPCFQFHSDDHTATINVALSPPSDYEGGDLLCLTGFSLQRGNPQKIASSVRDTSSDSGSSNEGLACDASNRDTASQGPCLLTLTGRTEGSAVAHQGSVCHGVSPITQGDRYALVIFFDSPEWRSQQQARAAAGALQSRSPDSPPGSLDGLLARPRRSSQAAHQYTPGERTPGRYRP